MDKLKKKIENMRKDSSVLFIGDNRSKIYHNKLCETVRLNYWNI